MAEAATLFKSILERSASAQQRQNYAMIQETELLSSSNTTSEDGRLAFLRRQKQALDDLTTLQQKSTKRSYKFNNGSSSFGVIQEWKQVMNPALIEAICLEGGKDSYGASVASELMMELFNQGYALNRTRFRYLIRYVGVSHTSKGAEQFIGQLVEMTKSLSSMIDQQPKDAHSTLSPLLKDSRKMRQMVDSASQILIEVGLQEVIKQATVEKDFNRARRVFQGMMDEGISLDTETSEKLIVGLTIVQDFRTVLIVLDKSLQEKRVPSIEIVNQVLKGLIKYHMLDEAVALFRDLTENHGLKPDVTMYRNLMHLTSAHGQLGMAQRILSTLQNMGVERDGDLYRDLMLCHVRVENLRGAIKVYESMNQAGVKNEITHINVLLEGAARYSSPMTVVGILEIMSAQSIHPDAETWNILLGGAFRARDRVLAQSFYEELIHKVVEGFHDKADGALRASRHPDTFQLLVNEHAERHGVEPTLKLLKDALSAGYPTRIASSMYRELIDKSCIQGKGIAGYGFYRLFRRSERRGDQDNNRTLGNKGVNSNAMERDPDSFLPHSITMSSAPAHAITSTSPMVVAPSLASLFLKLMIQLDHEGQIQVGTDLATDLILSGFEMDQDLVGSAIRFYAKTGELAAAFGLFMKMGYAYNVEPTRNMVQDLYEVARVQGLSLYGSSTSASSSTMTTTTTTTTTIKWDENVTQQWMRALRESMGK
ncbi:hypothetical protein BGZ65_006162, partial [Modicella reniformis]